MGRPRKTIKEEVRDFKEQQMDITDEVNMEDIAVEKVTLDPSFNRVALGIAPHPETGRKHVIEIPFNDKGEVGKISYLYEGDGMDMARERFKIDAQNKVLKSE